MRAQCPLCSFQFKMPGAQPTGVVRVWKEREPCAGHRECGSYVLHYTFDPFDSGVQGPQAAAPGPGHSGK